MALYLKENLTFDAARIIVNGLDLAIVLSEWGADGLGDLDRNDVVNGADLSAVLASWGPCPN